MRVLIDTLQISQTPQLNTAQSPPLPETSRSSRIHKKLNGSHSQNGFHAHCILWLQNSHKNFMESRWRQETSCSLFHTAVPAGPRGHVTKFIHLVSALNMHELCSSLSMLWQGSQQPQLPRGHPRATVPPSVSRVQHPRSEHSNGRLLQRPAGCAPSPLPLGPCP